MNDDILNSLMNSFLNYIAVEKRYSCRTVELYRDAIERFYSSTAADNMGADAKEVFTKNNVRNHIVSLSEEELTPRSINLHLSALSSFCKYLVGNNVLYDNPVITIKRPKVEKRLPRFFEEDAINRVADCLAADFLPHELSEDGKEETIDEVYKRERDALIVLMLYATGMRRILFRHTMSLSRSRPRTL